MWTVPIAWMGTLDEFQALNWVLAQKRGRPLARRVEWMPARGSERGRTWAEDVGNNKARGVKLDENQLKIRIKVKIKVEHRLRGPIVHGAIRIRCLAPMRLWRWRWRYGAADTCVINPN
jgi:hypothetical protein